MRKPLVTLAVAAVAAVGLGMPPALAATATWTVTPGGDFSSLATTSLSDTTTGLKLVCPQSDSYGNFSHGSGLSNNIGGYEIGAPLCYPAKGGPGIAIGFQGYAGPTIRAYSYEATTGQTAGRVKGVIMWLSGSGCTAQAAGPAAGAKASLRFTYTDSTGVLSVTSQPDLTLHNVSSECAGLLNINDGDSLSFHVSAAISPKQTITSP
ncbi:MAG TPA: hypothetical protein VGH27_02710 [Streptosporangiaceae bacterium]|jgi:hypothetical protein